MTPSALPAGHVRGEAEAVRIGIDLGGTKIEGIVFAGATERARARIATPRGDYAATVMAIADLVEDLERSAGVDAGAATVGIGMPGSLSRATGLVQNANSTWLNKRPFDRDLATRLARPVRLANDANCFALSEAVDGAGATSDIVFGVILGTGCGGGIVMGRRLLDGPRGIGGEWGHNPLPWSAPDEHPGPRCWCGRLGCMEVWVSGPGMSGDHARMTGETVDATEIALRAEAGDIAALETLQRHAGRLARGLAHVVNIVDPDVIVLGGGLSKLPHLYTWLPQMMAPLVFADEAQVQIVPPQWGDAGGVRGAAWLWGGPVV